MAPIVRMIPVTLLVTVVLLTVVKNINMPFRLEVLVVVLFRFMPQELKIWMP